MSPPTVRLLKQPNDISDNADTVDRFTSLIANGATTAAYQYVRVDSNSNSPVLDVTSNDIRCNVGAGSNGASMGTSSVAAGSTVRRYSPYFYHVFTDLQTSRSDSKWTKLFFTLGLSPFTLVCVQPVYSALVADTVSLGKAPSTTASWDGSGANWFKIYQIVRLLSIPLSSHPP